MFVPVVVVESVKVTVVQIVDMITVSDCLVPASGSVHVLVMRVRHTVR